MMELRWLCKSETTTEAPRLQYRVIAPFVDASGALNVAGCDWAPWTDVPFVDAALAPSRAALREKGE